MLIEEGINGFISITQCASRKQYVPVGQQRGCVFSSGVDHAPDCGEGAGRIDDPSTGWKGRGLWVGNEVRNPLHIEVGKGTYAQATHFQLRPDPLAK
jgi:hypothetical protein